ncbi:DNA helicase [Dictyobacter vulcani]|uniref:DNA 3'-5' helicase n=1 Tax=Dictyobacter vulcani TaxID=2607529 RepID=A0A5J4KPV7_9CHLR|nr:UvrD-helicase domain-containing protein [Dictyobacter vulcani]GER87236.1 DNA helicase [Dictyobacter vulcani]
MDNVLRLNVEAAARLVLSKYRATHPTWTDDVTPIDDLASWLGLNIATFDVKDYAHGTYGFMDPDEDEDLIWICRRLAETFRRFTLAHEIGHALLHCREGRRFQILSARQDPLLVARDKYASVPDPSPTNPCHDQDIQEDMASLLEQEQVLEKLGGTHGYDPRSERELAANIFAAELLMPANRLYTLYVNEGLPAHQLATRFFVSPTALLNRLAGFLDQAPIEPEVQVEDSEPAKTTPPNTMPAKKAYDEFQQAAIETTTPALIVAGPGSGKTSTLIGRVDYLVRVQNIAPQHILALTFSRKATTEMEERLQQLLSDSEYAMPKVSTFHAFCAELLRRHGSLVGLRSDFTLIDEAEGYDILLRQANALRLRHYGPLPAPTRYFPDILKAISRAKDELTSPEEYARLAQSELALASDEKSLIKAQQDMEIAQAYTLYQQELQRRGDSDYGGLLISAIQLLEEHSDVLAELQQTFEQILVDEFQDVNRASGVLLRVLAGEARRVWVVGDANQAIYGFRGASPANISQFEQDFPEARVLPLSRNYRSRPDLVALAEAFRCQQLEQGQDVGKNEPVRLTHPDTYVTIATAPDGNSEVAGLIADIQQKHAQGYAYRDMAILCRRRSLVKKITNALIQANIPVIEQGGMLDRDYVKNVLALPLLMIDPSSMGLMRAALQPEHPLSQQDIEALLLAAREPGSSPRLLLMTGEAPLEMSVEGRRALLHLSQILQSLLRTTNIWSLLAQYLLIETSLIRNLLAHPEHKQNSIQLADYRQLLQLARHYDQQQLLHQQLARQEHQKTEGTPEQEVGDSSPTIPIEEQARGFLQYIRLLALLRQDNANRQENTESSAEPIDTISVMTIHASKGLEFPVVYMPELMERRFPAQRQHSPVTPPEGMLASAINSHEVAESCLFYVGVTRARDQLVLSYSERYKTQAYKRSLYLDTLEAGLPEERIVKRYWQPAATTIQEDEPESLVAPGAQPGLDFIAAMRSPTLSASAVENYMRCPRQYAYGSIYHFEDEPNGYRLFRQATQKTEEILHRELGGAQDLTQLPTQKEIQQLYTQHWQDLGGDNDPFSSMYEEHGHEVVESIRRTLTTQEELDWNLRSGYNIDVAGTNIHVRVDRVESANEQSPQPVRFVRTSYGSSKSKPEAKVKDLFYTLAYRQQYPGQNVELHSHNMSTGESVPITIGSRKEKNLYQKIEQAVKGLENNEYPARPEDQQGCPKCPFFFICPT